MFNLKGILLPIFEAIITMMDQILSVGFDQLEPQVQDDLKSYFPTVYVFLKTKGKELVAKTATTLDDKGVDELIQAIEKISDEHNIPLPSVPA